MGGRMARRVPPSFAMLSPRLARRAALGLLLLIAPLPLPAADLRLSADQQARLQQTLPKTLAKLQRRELLRVVSIGDSLSTFYQPPGFPRYDSAMAWQGRLLNRLGGYFYYHGIVDVVPHREIAASQKQATDAWTRFAADQAAWQISKKGDPPQAPDALRFLADIAAPTPMGVPELIRRGVPQAQQIVQGTAIQILNLARDGAQAAQAWEALGPEAFPPPPASPPDLVTLCYGLNDAAANLPLDGYRAFLQEAVALCLKNGAEVLVAAPPVSFDPSAPRESIGRARPYAQISRAIAEAAKVAFVDLGTALLEAPSDLASLTAADAFAAATVPLAQAFTFRADAPDTRHPNAAATLAMGERAARQLLDGPTASPLEISGAVELTGPATATAQLRIFNPTATPRSLVLSPLSFTGWRLKPGTPDAFFNLAPGKARRLNLPLEPASPSPAPLGGILRGSLIVSDDDLQQLVDVALPLRPLSLAWPEGRRDAASGEVVLTATLTNQSANPVQGTATLEWLGQQQQFPIALEPKKSLPLPLRLALPNPATTPRFLGLATLQIALPDRVLRFERHLEGLRYLGLEQRFPLTPLAPAKPGDPAPKPDTWVTPFADARGLYCLIEAPAASRSPNSPQIPWGTVELQIDGRQPGANGSLGFVDRLSATIPWSDGPVTLRKIRPATFGHSYHYQYHPDGFRVTATTRPDGSRRLEFNVARVNLPQHQWSLDGSGQNSLGFNVRLTRPDPTTSQADPALTQTLAASAFGSTDARSLTVLELSRSPAPLWSLRIF